MIGTVEQELCPAGNGAEFPDFQPISIDGILVEDIMLFKFSGVMDKVMVHGIIPHGNGRVRDGIFQINRPCIVKTGIHGIFGDLHTIASFWIDCTKSCPFAAIHQTLRQCFGYKKSWVLGASS